MVRSLKTDVKASAWSLRRVDVEPRLSLNSRGEAERERERAPAGSERANLEVELGDLKQSLAAGAEAGVLGGDTVGLERFSHNLLQHLGRTGRQQTHATSNRPCYSGLHVDVLTQELDVVLGTV